MKVIFTSPGLLEAASKRGGGIEEIDLQVGLELSQDMDVTLVGSFFSREKYEFRKQIGKGLTVEQLPVMAGRNYPIITRADTVYTQVMTPLFAAACFWRMLFLRKRSGAVCVVHNGLPGLAATVACRLRGIRTIFSEGNTIPWLDPTTSMTRRKKVFQSVLERLFLSYGMAVAKFSTIIRVQSKTIEQGMVDRGIDRGRISIIPAGVNVHDYAPLPDIREKHELTFGFLGRLVDEKGVGFLLKVIQELQKIHPEIRFSILGDGPYRPALDACPNVIRTGHVKRESLNSMFQDAEVFLFFQKEIGLGELEVMSTGRVIISLETPENKSVIENGVNGFLCEMGLESYLACIESVLKRREEWDSIGQRARETILNDYSWRKISDQWRPLIVGQK